VRQVLFYREPVIPTIPRDEPNGIVSDIFSKVLFTASSFLTFSVFSEQEKIVCSEKHDTCFKKSCQ